MIAHKQPVVPEEEQKSSAVINCVAYPLTEHSRVRCITFVDDRHLICSQENQLHVYDSATYQHLYTMPTPSHKPRKNPKTYSREHVLQYSHLLACGEHLVEYFESRAAPCPFIAQMVCAPLHQNTTTYHLITAHNNTHRTRCYMTVWQITLAPLRITRIQTLDNIVSNVVPDETLEASISHLLLSPCHTKLLVGHINGYALFDRNTTTGQLTKHLTDDTRQASGSAKFTILTLQYKRLLNILKRFTRLPDVLCTMIGEYDGVCEQRPDTLSYNVIGYKREAHVSPCGTWCAAFGPEASYCDTSLDHERDADYAEYDHEEITLLNMKDNSLQTLYNEILRTNHLKRYVMKIAYSPCSSYLAAGFSDGSATIWNTNGYRVYGHKPDHPYSIIDLTFSPNNRCALYQENGSVTIIHPHQFRKIIT